MAVLPVLAAVAVVLAGFARLRRTWTDAVDGAALALPLALAAAVGSGLGASGAAEGAASLAALRAEPYRLLDPERRGVPFDLLAWPAAAALGDLGAVRFAAGALSASALLLGYALFRSAGLGRAGAVIGQAALAAVPLLAIGVGPALFAHALPEALALLLLAHLVRRLGHLEGARDNAAAFAFLLLAEAPSAVATLEVALFAAAAALAEAAAGAWRRGLRLAASAALATAAVALVRYAPRLLDWPAQAAHRTPEPSWSALPLGLTALGAGAAVVLLPRATRAPRLFAAALGAGVAAVIACAAAQLATPTAPGLALLAPAAACAPGAMLVRLRSRRSGPAAPGSRS